jgi:hypothetical protein
MAQRDSDEWVCTHRTHPLCNLSVKPSLEKYAAVIKSLPDPSLSGGDSLPQQLLLDRDGAIEIFYAPFEYSNPNARIVIVGITPGRVQAVNAIRAAQSQLKNGASVDTALKAAKSTGSFSGPMRNNLVAMLDYFQLNEWLRIGSCADLFGPRLDLAQFDSLLRFPVFLDDSNYNGKPSMMDHPLLAASAGLFRGAVFIPLGDQVGGVFRWLTERRMLDGTRVLDGFQHPSGANAERIAYLIGRKPREALSSKTNPDKIDAARDGLWEKIRGLKSVSVA